MVKVKSIFITLLTLILLGIGIASEYSAQTGFALETSQSVYERRNVMDDLNGSTVNGIEFDISDYPYNEYGEPQLISFIEFCYSNAVEKRDDFGLYIYVYNPAQTTFDLNSEYNCIQLRTGGDQSASFSNDYKLKYLNSGNDGLFLKFKINLTSVQKQGILSRLQSDERVYEVSGFELMWGNDITEYTVGMTYRYSGYAEGCAPDAAQDGTLSCISEGGLKTLYLKPEYTAFRPDGSNGKNEFTQDSLHSVYFAVPNKIIEEYGEMSQIHAKWLNATLKPGLVTGNKAMYEKLLPIAAHQITMSNLSKYSSYGLSWNYMYLGNCDVVDGSSGLMPEADKIYYDFALMGTYHEPFESIFPNSYKLIPPKRVGEKLDELPILLYSPNGKADRFKFESTKELYNYIRQYPYVCPIEIDPLSSFIMTGADQKLVAGKYPSTLFSKYDTDYTEVWANATDETPLKDFKVSKEWWQHIFGGVTQTERDTYKDLKAIYPVTEEDLSDSDEVLSKRLCIGLADVEEFRVYCEEAMNNESTVYLFRFYQSEYIAQTATLARTKKGSLGLFYHFTKVDSNAYFFQTDVNLNFDIIDISYDNGTKVTTIPVIMSPIDIIPNPTPPIEIEEYIWWHYGVGIMAALVCVGIVAKIIDKGARKV